MKQYMVFLFDNDGREIVSFAGTASEDMLEKGLVAARVTFPHQFLGGRTFRSLIGKFPGSNKNVVCYVETASKPV